MNILIIDDDEPKRTEIGRFISESGFSTDLKFSFSYQSGLKSIMTGTYDIVVLDMSLTTYDPTIPNPRGGRPRPFGGLDILKEIKRKKIGISVIVITQFSILKEGETEQMTFDELANHLADNYQDVCLGTIYYQHSDQGWQEHLASLLNQEKNDD